MACFPHWQGYSPQQEIYPTAAGGVTRFPMPAASSTVLDSRTVDTTWMPSNISAASISSFSDSQSKSAALIVPWTPAGNPSCFTEGLNISPFLWSAPTKFPTGFWVEAWEQPRLLRKYFTAAAAAMAAPDWTAEKTPLHGADGSSCAEGVSDVESISQGLFRFSSPLTALPTTIPLVLAGVSPCSPGCLFDASIAQESISVAASMAGKKM